MSQGIRDLLANRKFAIPLIIMLAICFVGLLLLGIVFIVKPGSKTAAEPQPTAKAAVVQVTETSSPIPILPTQPPTNPTAAPTNTLVPIGTAVVSVTDTSPAAQATTAVDAAATSAPAAEEDELAQTGVGWGLIVASGAGLALLFIVARRLRLAS